MAEAPTTPDVALPAAMIEAAARAMVRHRFVRESMWDDPGIDEPEAWRAVWRLEARVVLAAALGVCQVREQHGHAEDEHVVGNRWHDHRCPTSSLRRLVITTPAEPDPTAGQP